MLRKTYRMAFVTHIRFARYVSQRAGEIFGATLLTFPLNLSQRQTRAQRIWNNMVFKKKGIVPLDAVVNVRLTTDEKLRLENDADIAGISMSELVRARYFGRPVVANVNLVMIKELRRLGGLLKLVHTESKGAYSHETASMLRDVGRFIDRMSIK